MPWNINSSLPANYHQINVQEEIPINEDADGDGICDLLNPLTHACLIKNLGDNHRGYLGFRNSNLTDSIKLVDDGAMNIVVDSWGSSK